ncbi:hypothetical protein AMECASPLE_013811 [Ameca splendens]|uniref:Uncharacterized protein n=1 Tax=Ameca splendens TaxID=208324 RepID=A0ABV1A8M0_9TELE
MLHSHFKLNELARELICRGDVRTWRGLRAGPCRSTKRTVCALERRGGARGAQLLNIDLHMPPGSASASWPSTWLLQS